MRKRILARVAAQHSGGGVDPQIGSGDIQHDAVRRRFKLQLPQFAVGVHGGNVAELLCFAGAQQPGFRRRMDPQFAANQLEFDRKRHRL